MSIIDNLVYDRTQADVDRVKELTKKMQQGVQAAVIPANVLVADINQTTLATQVLTESDIAEWKAGMKGAWNYTDINRVGEAVGYLAQRYAAIPNEIEAYRVEKSVGASSDFDVPYNPGDISVAAKKNWTVADIMSKAAAKTFLEDLIMVRKQLTMPSDTPLVPTSLDSMDYNTANDIEKMLSVINATLEGVKADRIGKIDNVVATGQRWLKWKVAEAYKSVELRGVEGRYNVSSKFPSGVPTGYKGIATVFNSKKKRYEYSTNGFDAGVTYISGSTAYDTYFVVDDSTVDPYPGKSWPRMMQRHIYIQSANLSYDQYNVMVTEVSYSVGDSAGAVISPSGLPEAPGGYSKASISAPEKVTGTYGGTLYTGWRNGVAGLDASLYNYLLMVDPNGDYYVYKREGEDPENIFTIDGDDLVSVQQTIWGILTLPDVSVVRSGAALGILGDISKVVIPESVETIEANAFDFGSSVVVSPAYPYWKHGDRYTSGDTVIGDNSNSWEKFYAPEVAATYEDDSPNYFCVTIKNFNAVDLIADVQLGKVHRAYVSVPANGEATAKIYSADTGNFSANVYFSVLPDAEKDFEVYIPGGDSRTETDTDDE